MGRRGPRPTPTRDLQRWGSWRAALRTCEPDMTALVGVPPCPKWLDREGRRAWKFVTAGLAARGLLTQVDGQALVRYCRIWSRWMAMERYLLRHGPTYTVRSRDGKRSRPRPWPQAALAAKLGAQLTEIEREFGLTPGARAWMRLRLEWESTW
ncbi:MAG: phage terminase small subunit P27 family [Phycisphaerales bacterium]